MIQQSIAIGSGGGYTIYHPTSVAAQDSKTITLAGVTERPHCIIYVQGNFRAILIIDDSGGTVLGIAGSFYPSTSATTASMTYLYNETASTLTLTVTNSGFSNFNNATTASFNIF